jgi:glutamine synthetase
MRHAPLVVAADRLQLAKYLVHNAAQAAGRSATFMPKPLAYAPGSGLHVNLSLWRDGVPLFAREPDTLRGFIAGILAHAPALGAFTSPSTNGFKRLAALFTPGQPIGYGPGNRAAAIRLPEAASESALRLECRFPDAASNPYLVLAALTMAGLDGIRRGLDPGPPLQGDPRRVLEGFDVRRRHEPALASDLADAVITLDRDRAFLMRGEVFTSELIEAQIADLNRQIRVARSLPHPNEYYLSYGA